MKFYHANVCQAAINQSINQSINQNAQPAMFAGQLTLTHYHVTPEPRRE
jgi:hypothetical protein